MENKKEFNFLDLFKNSFVFTIKNGKCVGNQPITEDMKRFYIEFIEEKIGELVEKENGVYKLPYNDTELGNVVTKIARDSIYYDFGVFKKSLEFGDGSYGFHLDYQILLNDVVTQSEDTCFVEAILTFISKKKLLINLEDPIITACIYGNLHALKLLRTLSNDYNLVQKNAILACDDNRPLIEATMQNEPEIVDYLLKYKNEGVNPAARKNEPIYNACRYGTSEMVKTLLKHKEVDPCANDFDALHVAYEIGNKEIIKILHNDERVSHKDFEKSKIRRKKEFEEAIKREEIEVIKNKK